MGESTNECDAPNVIGQGRALTPKLGINGLPQPVPLNAKWGVTSRRAANLHLARNQHHTSGRIGPWFECQRGSLGIRLVPD